MEYSLEHKRDLTIKEKEILTFLFQREKKEWISLIERLKVIARCGCGKCPTILFGRNFDDKIDEGNLIIDYFVETNNEGIVGISLFGNEKNPSQLEFYSVDGVSEITKIPDNYRESKKVTN